MHAQVFVLIVQYFLNAARDSASRESFEKILTWRRITRNVSLPYLNYTLLGMKNKLNLHRENCS